jgi:hypothetical protein
MVGCSTGLSFDRCLLWISSVINRTEPGFLILWVLETNISLRVPGDHLHLLSPLSRVQIYHICIHLLSRSESLPKGWTGHTLVKGKAHDQNIRRSIVFLFINYGTCIWSVLNIKMCSAGFSVVSAGRHVTEHLYMVLSLSVRPF